MPHALKSKPPAPEFGTYHDSDIREIAFPNIPGYTISRRLGMGGQASVYHATGDAGKQMALKVTPNYKPADPSAYLKPWFVRECAATLSINHPNVGRGISAGYTTDYCFLATEFIDGYPLNEALLYWRKLAWLTARNLMLGICNGLQAIHASLVTHRDIKPENIMLSSNNGNYTAKIIDFGLCYVDGYEDLIANSPVLKSHSVRGRLSPLNGAIGTPLYRAPEFDVPYASRNLAFDVYSAGIVFYEILTGFHPISNFVQNTPDYVKSLAQLHRTIIPLRPSELIPGMKLPKLVEDVIMAALEKSPANRPGLAELSQAFEKS